VSCTNTLFASCVSHNCVVLDGAIGGANQAGLHNTIDKNKKFMQSRTLNRFTGGESVSSDSLTASLDPCGALDGHKELGAQGGG